MENLLREQSIGIADCDSILSSFKKAVELDGDWINALLKTICEWTISSESVDGAEYQYLILGEGLDWLALAQRLCGHLENDIPENELNSLIMHGRFPHRFEVNKFKELIGPIKYGFYLNYWYGIVVEEAIQNAIERDIRKRHLALCYQDTEDLSELVYESLYGESRQSLMTKFLSEMGVSNEIDMTTTRLKEFNYWLHKMRINKWDPARVASDTKRGLLELEYYGISSF